MIAALFVSESGPYAEDPRFDAWGIERDARRYAGSDPVVAHPPCERWGRYAKGAPATQTKQIGDDGGCFSVALCKIRANGGVLEHPQASKAWAWFNLPLPPIKGWSHPDQWGGRSCEIDQGTYGHPAKKPTWLYAVLPSYPELDWRRVWDRPRVGDDGFRSARERARAKARADPVVRVKIDKDWHWRTPDRLKDELHRLAESAQGWRPEPAALRQVTLRTTVEVEG